VCIQNFSLITLLSGSVNTPGAAQLELAQVFSF